MAGLSDWDQFEYQALMARSRDAERTAQICWTAAGLAGAVLLSWGIAAKSASLMLPVIFAAAFGFYAAIHGRQQVRLVAGYVKEFIEPNGQSPQWFTRLSALEAVPGFNPPGDWALTALSNLLVVAAMVFGFHSITETARLRQTNASALWRQIAANADERRGPRLATRN